MEKEIRSNEVYRIFVNKHWPCFIRREKATHDLSEEETTAKQIENIEELYALR